MKTIFDQAERQKIIDRIDKLSPESQKQWGKMNVFQMVGHCIIFEEWVLGKNNPVYKQEFLGRIFGRGALKSMVKDDSPIKRNMPAGKKFIVKNADGNLEAQKKLWVGLIHEYANFSNPDFIHDFFGKMTDEQIGIFVYKHCDHHLRQFGV